MLALLPAAGLAACAAPLPPVAPGDAAAAQALLARSADAHGLAALDGLGDISVSYAGRWRPFVGRLQPDLVDAGFSGHSEERLLLRDRLTAQAHTGPDGRKQVRRRRAPEGGGRGSVQVWFNGTEARTPQDRVRRDAAALVADGYTLFLLGPMLLARQPLAAAGLQAVETIESGGQDHRCDVVRVRLAPGLGFSDGDDLALYLDRAAGLMRRVRFTLNGLDATQGAVAEVDLWGHVARHGIQWPTRFHERLLRPVPLGVHDWSLTGLDVRRGLDAAEVAGPAFTGKAAAHAAALA